MLFNFFINQRSHVSKEFITMHSIKSLELNPLEKKKYVIAHIIYCFSVFIKLFFK